ncbi:MAG TPA: hypothetical protein DEA05_01605 [Rhodobacteraceae bacterium]|nr:hypothetical protein [Paracoccaceae bacterium]
MQRIDKNPRIDPALGLALEHRRHDPVQQLAAEACLAIVRVIQAPTVRVERQILFLGQQQPLGVHIPMQADAVVLT